MLKVTENKSKERQLSFPTLMVTQEGVVLLATSYTNPSRTTLTGTIVFDPTGENELGEYSANWSVVAFRNYDGSITLENSKDENGSN